MSNIKYYSDQKKGTSSELNPLRIKYFDQDNNLLAVDKIDKKIFIKPPIALIEIKPLRNHKFTNAYDPYYSLYAANMYRQKIIFKKRKYLLFLELNNISRTKRISIEYVDN